MNIFILVDSLFIIIHVPPFFFSYLKISYQFSLLKIVKGVISPQRRKERKGKTRTIIQTEILDFRF
ncbi:MAG: hypothetical protein A2W17_11515 [Planctomycetes bacterium RBG_16_41_13]|nr:MAG: hypothetical protein A2W17_11515 [Planctomycetes bacterium RBG_16_41_13]